MKKRTAKQKNKTFKWVLNTLISCILLLLTFYLSESEELEEITSTSPPVLYASACHDDLQKLFIEAIESAQHSILLVIYSLSDSKLIAALNRQAEKGVAVQVVHDTTTPPFGFRKLDHLIDVQPVKRSGLMHQKILVVDHEKVWIGSANMTSESLRLHHNLVVGLINNRLADAIEQHRPFASLTAGGQLVEYWEFPKKGKEALERLLALIDGAKKTLRIAMFTWTHPELTQAVIRAHERKVDVEVLLDSGQAQGVCQKTLDALLKAHVKLRLSTGLGLLHHKFAWIDEAYLVNGSANWTQSAFHRNADCFLILHELTEEQNEKLRTLWHQTATLFDEEEMDVAA